MMKLKMCNDIIDSIDCNQILIKNNIFEEGYVYVYILQLNDFSLKSQSLIIKSEKDEIVFDMKKDGFYTLCRIKIPRDQTKPVYYYNSNFYFNEQKVDLQELVELNTNITELEINYTYFFQICRLKRCYIDIAKKVIDNSTSIKCSKSIINKNEDIYKRDLLWSAINVIQYLVEYQQFEEADYLLKRITGCNGLCNCNNQEKEQDCGCGH